MTGFLDGPDRSVEGFWQAVTGSGSSGRRGVDAEFVTLLPRTGDAFLRAQVVGSPPARCHLDLHVGDVGEQASRAVGLGASVVRDGGGLVVVRSPAGLVFCLVGWHGERVRPGAVRWPGGHRSLVDQMCLDVPVGVFDSEADFWAALTGWERRAAGLPEFDYLVRPQGMPLRLLLQRTGGGVPGMHLDLACDDVDAEVARQVGLGAVVVRRVPGDWTTLRDPAGREYCVTGRSPDIHG
jgi:glyoxalase superfamily protein